MWSEMVRGKPTILYGTNRSSILRNILVRCRHIALTFKLADSASTRRPSRHSAINTRDPHHFLAISNSIVAAVIFSYHFSVFFPRSCGKLSELNCTTVQPSTWTDVWIYFFKYGGPIHHIYLKNVLNSTQILYEHVCMCVHNNANVSFKNIMMSHLERLLRRTSSVEERQDRISPFHYIIYSRNKNFRPKYFSNKCESAEDSCISSGGKTVGRWNKRTISCPEFRRQSVADSLDSGQSHFDFPAGPRKRKIANPASLIRGPSYFLHHCQISYPFVHE